MTGIYFLFKDGSLIYIGQSGVVEDRLRGHEVDFDSYRVIECDEEKLRHYERRWINKFRPPNNIHLNPDRRKSKRYLRINLERIWKPVT